jgi:DNA-directed RNA polymerase subunit A'
MAMEETVSKVVNEVNFGIIPPQEVRRLSVAEIQTADTYDEDGAPITSGLMDGRLGTLEPRQRCRTCGNTAIRCPGHFGHVELAVPVVHIEFTKTIHNLLRATCRNCGRILLPVDQIAKIKAGIKRARKLRGTVPDDVYKRVLKKPRGKE